MLCKVSPPWFSMTYRWLLAKKDLYKVKSRFLDTVIIHEWIFFSFHRKNNYFLHNNIAQQRFWRKYSFQGIPNQVGKPRKFQGGGGGQKWKCPPWRYGYFHELHSSKRNNSLRGAYILSFHSTLFLDPFYYDSRQYFLYRFSALTSFCINAIS